MKRILLLMMALVFSLAPYAQKQVQKKRPVRKTAVAAKPQNRKKKTGKAGCPYQGRTQGGYLQQRFYPRIAGTACVYPEENQGAGTGTPQESGGCEEATGRPDDIER